MTTRLALLAGAALSVAGLVASSAFAALDTYSSPSAYTAAVGLEKFALDFTGSTGAAVPGNAFSTKVKFGSPEAPSADRGLVLWSSNAITDMGSTTAANGVGPIEGVFSDPPCAFAFDYASGKLGTVELYGVDDAPIGALPGGVAGFFGVVSPTVPIRRFVISGNLFAPGARDRIFVDNFRVNECITNTAPSVTVTGVTNGARYEYSAVPAAGCAVSDGEDGPSSFAATLGSIAGPRASSGLGSRKATCSHTDSGGLHAEAEATYVIVDTTPPELTLPTEWLFYSNSPQGGFPGVFQPLEARDEIDGEVPVTCDANFVTIFPIGRTLPVTCEARDAEGNTAIGSFPARAMAVEEMLAHLQRLTETLVTDDGLRRSLVAKLRWGTCGPLGAFLNELQAEVGRRIGASSAGDLRWRADSIRRTLACR